VSRLLSFAQVECSPGAGGFSPSEEKGFEWVLDGNGLRPDVDGHGKPIPFCVMGATEEAFDLVEQGRWGEDQALDFRFTITTPPTGRVGPDLVAYSGPWIGWQRVGPMGGAIYPFRYFRLTPYGSVDWGVVLGGRGREQQPTNTVAALDYPIKPAYADLERWQFRLWLESNPVEPDFRREELVMSCGLEGRYFGTWRFAPPFVIRPLIYVEGSCSTFRVTVDDGVQVLVHPAEGEEA